MDSMGVVGGLYLLCLVSPLLFWVSDRWRARRAASRCLTPVPGAAQGISRDRPALESLVADLQRLEQQYQRIDADNPPAKMQRLTAVSLAYDDVLGECCSALGLPPPTERPLSSGQRLLTESELALRGLTW